MPRPVSKICYLASHGFAARMLMQTNLLGRLRSYGLEVDLIVPNNQDPVLKLYCQQNAISLHHFKSSGWWWKTNFSLYRSYFLEDLKNNPALLEKHIFEIKNPKHKYVLLSWIPSILYTIHPLFRKFTFMRSLYRRFEHWLLVDTKAQTIIKSLRPDLLISTYPANPHEGVLVHNAHRLNIETVIHLLSWDNISSKGHFLSLADHYFSWGSVMHEEFKSHYPISENQIRDCGVPHFDVHAEISKSTNKISWMQVLNLDPQAPYLLFGMSAPRFVPKEIDLVEFLARAVEQNEFGSTMQLLVRPHPQNVQGNMSDSSWIERLKAIESKRIRIFYPKIVEGGLPWSMEHDDMHVLSSALCESTVCINSCSTLSLDALMAGTGNIAPLFDGETALPYWTSAIRLKDFPHIKKFIELGGTELATSYIGLIELIKKFQADRNWNLQKRLHARQCECGPADGQSTQRVVDSILNLLHSKNPESE